MKIYIAGPITGVPDYRERFAAAAGKVRERAPGAVILDPTVLPEGMTPGDYMRICLSMIDTADTVVLLPGWEESAGARIEAAYCEYSHKPMYKMAAYAGEEKPKAEPEEAEKHELTARELLRWMREHCESRWPIMSSDVCKTCECVGVCRTYPTNWKEAVIECLVENAQKAKAKETKG